MLNIILTQNSTPIIGFCAKILGKVMEWLYLLFSKGLSIENIGLCIIVFTLLIKLLMIPMTVKQQKFSKLSTLMNPEIQEIQKKYKDKRDNESMMKMNEETQAVYRKYGTSPTGSCLQLLIQMPILFSLYYIVSSIPAYVPQVYNYYQPASNVVVSDYDEYKYLNDAYDKYVLEEDQEDPYQYIDNMISSFKGVNTGSEKKVIDKLARYSTKQWEDIVKSYEGIDEMVEKLSENVTDEEWKEFLDSIEDKDEKKNVEGLIEAVKSNDISKYIESSNSEIISNAEKKVMEINKFGPINLSQSPRSVMGIALIIPILCFITQWLTTQIAMKANQAQMEDNPMNNSMKVMNVMMPLMTTFIALGVPAGLGLYWAFNGIFQIIAQVCINAYFKKVDVQDIINSNVEKMNKKKARQGIDTSKVSSNALTSTKNIQSRANINKNADAKGNSNGNVKYKAGSMAAKANMVKEYNEKNRK